MSLYIIGIIALIFFLNTAAAIVTVFSGKRDIASIWAWLLVLLLFPIFGFLIYGFLGRKISSRKSSDLRTQEDLGMDQIVENQRHYLQEANADQLRNIAEQDAFINLFLNNDASILTRQNDVDIYTDGNALFPAIFEEIEKAEHHVHLEFFSISDDSLGNELIDLLTKKAKAGLEVRVIFDQWGSHGYHRKMYKRLVDAGGHVEAFMQPRYFPITFRANFRNHRKMVIVDGTVGFIGGFNVGDEYIGRSKKFGPWRDTHIRINGDAVLAMQSRFFMDWNATTRHGKLTFSETYFPEVGVQGNTAIQIVSSGPDQDIQQIKQGYMRAMAGAQRSITIQTPYFIPDQGVLDLLQIVAMSGVRVRLMIPNKPDHPFVYRATQYYAREMLAAGAEVYTYENGFLHAKVVTVDGVVSSVGSANMDMRSFSLNFEANAFMYSEKIAKELEAIFEADLAFAKPLTEADFLAQSKWLTFKQTFSRLLSPIL